MMSLGAFLVVLSPYTALIPVPLCRLCGVPEPLRGASEPRHPAQPLELRPSVRIHVGSGSGIRQPRQALLSGGLRSCRAIWPSASTSSCSSTRKNKAETLIRTVHHMSVYSALLGLLEKAASFFVDMSWISRFF